MKNFKIIAIPALTDNYIWTVNNLNSLECLIVDPGESEQVISYLIKNNLTPKAILITHKHYDHTGGAKFLADKYQLEIYGPAIEAANLITQPLNNNSIINLIDLDITALHIPGHTLGHIAFFIAEIKALFCGDTLFSAGCGRVFEGTMQQMYNSLNTLKQLPEATRVYCGHEYTLNNLKFAQIIYPYNKNIKNYLDKLIKNPQDNTLPSTIKIEKLINPFFIASDLTEFTTIRTKKDVY